MTELSVDQLYAGGFAAGDVCEYNGILSIGRRVTVVEWTPEKWWGEEYSDNFITGMVPIYSELFPETKFWWACPHQLKIIS